MDGRESILEITTDLERNGTFFEIYLSLAWTQSLQYSRPVLASRLSCFVLSTTHIQNINNHFILFGSLPSYECFHTHTDTRAD